MRKNSKNLKRETNRDNKKDKKIFGNGFTRPKISDFKLKNPNRIIE